MGSFANTMMNVLLGWMRGVVDWVWKLIESPGTGGALSWFGHTWWMIALVLVGGGLVVDWLVWLIRWQPYHIWATRLRRIRRFFAHKGGMPVQTVETMGVSGQAAAGYMPVYPSSEYSGEPFGVQDGAQNGAAYDEGYGQVPESFDDRSYYGAEDYDEGGYDAQTGYAGTGYEAINDEAMDYADGAYGDEAVWDDTEAVYAQAQPYMGGPAEGGYEDGDENGYDPLAAYRRPMASPAPSNINIPDAQLRDYPGRHFDPTILPPLPRRGGAPDPLAAYDAYASPGDHLPIPTVDADDDVAWASEARATPRRTRRRAAQDAQPKQPQVLQTSLAGEENQRYHRVPEADGGVAPAARILRRGQPVREADRWETDGWDEPWEEADEVVAAAEETTETMAALETLKVPETVEAVPKLPASKQARPGATKSLLAGRAMGSKNAADKAQPKKRNRLAQFIDPQTEQIKGLPPRIDKHQAFRAPTYPDAAPAPIRNEDPGSGMWDDDT